MLLMTQDHSLEKDQALVKKRWEGFTVSRVLFPAIVPTFLWQVGNHSSRLTITDGFKRSYPEVLSEPLLSRQKFFRTAADCASLFDLASHRV